MKFFAKGLAVLTAMILILWLVFPMNIIVSKEQSNYDNFSAPLLFSRLHPKNGQGKFQPQLSKSHRAEFEVGSQKVILRQHEPDLEDTISLVDRTFIETANSEDNPYDQWNHFAEKFTPVGMTIQGESVTNNSQNNCTLIIHGLEKSAGELSTHVLVELNNQNFRISPANQNTLKGYNSSKSQYIELSIDDRFHILSFFVASSVPVMGAAQASDISKNDLGCFVREKIETEEIFSELTAAHSPPPEPTQQDLVEQNLARQ